MAAEHLAAAAHDRAVASEERARDTAERLWRFIGEEDRRKLRYIETQVQFNLKDLREEPVDLIRTVRREIFRQAQRRSTT